MKMKAVFLKQAGLLLIGVLLACTAQPVAAQDPQPVGEEKGFLPDQPVEIGTELLEVAISEVDNQSEVILAVNQSLALVLNANLTTGYSWKVESFDPAVIQVSGEPEYRSPGNRFGGSGKQIIRFMAVGNGKSTIQLVYQRPFEADAQPADRITYQVAVGNTPGKGVDGGVEAMIYEIPGIVDMPALDAPSSAPEIGIETLSEHYNWCELGKCTPIKNQGGCGSCWAFATTAPLEMNILIQENRTVSLSEQYLVSCNSDGWSCSGGWWAHNYHQWKYVAGESGPGAVYTSDFPYQASNVACNPSHTHHEQLTNWGFLAGYSVPTYEQMKQAIQQYGPITVGVCVGSAFQSYQDGIFTTNESAVCNGGINHAVVLVGWDDSDNVLYMRNSWGTWWGEDGYMRIRPGTSNIGYAASYVYYAADDNPLPQPPSDLDVSSLSPSSVEFSWSDNSTNEDGFVLEQSTDGDTWSEVANLPADTTYYQQDDLACGSVIYYRVHAYNQNGVSLDSNIAVGSTLSCNPGMPTNLSGAASSTTSINLTWSDNSYDEQGFKIERSIDGSTGWTQLGTVGANVTTYRNSGLSCSTAYSYRVRSYHSGGNSEYSNTVRPLTAACAVTAPTNLTATAVSSTSIRLNWTDNSSNETGFKVERSLNGTSGWTEIVTIAANGVTYTNTGLACGTAYSYRVRAYNASGVSAYSGTVRRGTFACPPAAPTALLGTALSTSSIRLNWTDNSSNEEGFKIERSLNGTTGWTQLGTVAANVTTYTNSGLVCGTAYSYRVRSYLSTGNSGYSNAVRVTTSACAPSIPPTPATLTATAISGAAIRLNWTDSSSNELGFKIERSLDGSTGWAQLGTVGVNVTTYTNSGLACGTAYSYRVRAYNASGNSSYSNTVRPSTQACAFPAPGSLSAAAQSATSIRLSWVDTVSGEAGFYVERSANGSTGWAVIYTAGANTTAYVNASLTCGTRYYYRLRAFSGGNYSPYSSVANAVTAPCSQ